MTQNPTEEVTRPESSQAGKAPSPLRGESGANRDGVVSERADTVSAKGLIPLRDVLARIEIGGIRISELAPKKKKKP